MVLDSSTVITPSLPTLFIASAMMLPIVESPFAETVPTCAIASPLTGFAKRLISSVRAFDCFVDAALEGHRVSARGNCLHAFAEDSLSDTVAVVVPSPATSEVLEATSQHLCAMFSRLSLSSIPSRP